MSGCIVIEGIINTSIDVVADKAYVTRQEVDEVPVGIQNQSVVIFQSAIGSHVVDLCRTDAFQIVNGFGQLGLVKSVRMIDVLNEVRVRVDIAEGRSTDSGLDMECYEENADEGFPQM